MRALLFVVMILPLQRDFMEHPSIHVVWESRVALTEGHGAPEYDIDGQYEVRP